MVLDSCLPRGRNEGEAPCRTPDSRAEAAGRQGAPERARCPGRGSVHARRGVLVQLVSDHTRAKLVCRLPYKSLDIVDLLLSPISCY